MTIRRVSAGILLALSAAACVNKDAAGGDSTRVATLSVAAADSAAQFAQAFYDWYASGGARFEVTVRDSAMFFGPELLNGLQEDLAAQAKNPGDIVGLDWDPFVASQDPCAAYRVGQPRIEGSHVLVPVSCSDASAGVPAVVAEVARAAPSWVFVNFRHGSDTGSVLTDLAELRRGRSADSARGHE